MFGGYEGGWNPGDYLMGDAADFPTDRYQNKAGHDYMDFKDWSLRKWQTTDERDKGLQNIYLSAKMMKFHPQITKDLRKTYGLVASAAMRAMSPEAKFKLKAAMSPYSQLKKSLADDLARRRAVYGIKPRKGLAGRIAYWNALQNTSIDNLTDALDDLYTVGRESHSLKGFEPKSMYKGTYGEYKQALKDKAAARRAITARMTEAERKTYKHQLRVLQAARAAMKKAREADRLERRSATDLVWGPMTAKDWAASYRDEIAKAIAEKPEKYADVNVDDIYNVMINPKASLFQNFFKGNEAAVALRPLADSGPTHMTSVNLTSRGPYDWKGTAPPPAAREVTPWRYGADHDRELIANSGKDVEWNGVYPPGYSGPP